MIATAQGQLSLEPFVSGLSDPVFFMDPGDGSGRLFVVEQGGRILIVDPDGSTHPTPFLDISVIVASGGERGLLGLAFHPDFSTNGKFYVNYTSAANDTRIEEYQVSAGDPDIADPGSGRIVMVYDQPAFNHNGGWIGFSPNDGYLYIAAGDGGNQGDPDNRAGNLSEYLGKMHRVDVDSGDDFPGDDNQNYAVPADNPFVGISGAVQSIWAYGLRNPWRNSFDRETGDLWIADVGQWTYEEVNYQPASSPGGEHYGWRCREGLHATGSACGATSGFTDPVHEYTHGANGCSIIGGYLYRGCALGEAYRGHYLFSDTCSGRVWTLDPSNGFTSTLEMSTGAFVSSFGEDAEGELYIVDLNGNISRLVNPGANGGCDAVCQADLTGDGSLDFFDVSAFLMAYTQMNPLADFNDDGAYDFFDVSAFLMAYNQGCP